MRRIWMFCCIVMFTLSLAALAPYGWLAVLRGWSASSFFACALILWLLPGVEATEEPPEGGAKNEP